MPLKTPCRHCGTNIEHEDWMSGTEVKCPACGQMTLLAQESPVTASEILKQSGLQRNRNAIRTTAERFKNAAVWLCILAAIAFCLAILYAVNQDDKTDAEIAFMEGSAV